MITNDLLVHSCTAQSESAEGPHGPAIGLIFFSDKQQRWEVMAGANEYLSAVTYCPFCGVKLVEGG